ncbi:MAG: OB-fold domain-containing protein [Actinomycetia bacterium]|nr:OB-fold domain-containing protein [Actinomycetes bacterium]
MNETEATEPEPIDTGLRWRRYEARPVRESEGVGEVYSHSTLPNDASRGLAPFAPYVVALVGLAEGVRLMTNRVGCQPGQAVRLAWEPLTDGRHLPLFQPD